MSAVLECGECGQGKAGSPVVTGFAANNALASTRVELIPIPGPQSRYGRHKWRRLTLLDRDSQGAANPFGEQVYEARLVDISIEVGKEPAVAIEHDGGGETVHGEHARQTVLEVNRTLPLLLA